MAKQLSCITFTGRLGNMIGYERKGKYYLRSMPEIVRQTAATRRAAKRFGMASRKGALVRKALYRELAIPSDSGHINRLNKLLIGAGGDHTALNGFSFSQHAGLHRFFTVIPLLSDDGTLHIPPQELIQHKHISSWRVKVIACRIDFTTGQATGTLTHHLTIDPATPFAGTDVQIDAPGEGTLLLAIQIMGMSEDRPSGNRQYLAADIIAVVPRQVKETVHDVTYPDASVMQHVSVNSRYTLMHQLIIQRE